MQILQRDTAIYHIQISVALRACMHSKYKTEILPVVEEYVKQFNLWFA